ncbi:hypothetical protein BH09PSE6_BH09PSE6_33300 [soil metagenome]
MQFALTAATESRWLSDLPYERRQQLLRWPDSAERHRSLIASRLLLVGLQRFGLPASLASLRSLARAKPTLDLPVDFSISHCEGRIVCAVSTAGSVGIDVEAVAAAVTGRQFTHYLDASERDWAGDDPRRFATLWTCKEAVAKAHGGAGMADLAQVRTNCHEGRASLHGRSWATMPLPVGRRHAACLASRPGAATVLEAVSRHRLLSLVS